jgi:class 3 adenylate cyclase
LSIAYQVVGDGAVDLVFVPFTISAVFSWIQPVIASFYEQLASFSRLILLDKRGIGASDRPRSAPTLEAQMDDLRAVLDAVGSERTAVFGSGHGGQMCSLFAATYPERTSALVLYDPFARHPGTPEEHQLGIRRLRDEWGRLETVEREIAQGYPSFAGDASFVRSMALILRASASPGSAAEFTGSLAEADISDVLPTIRVPTLVMYRRFAGVLKDDLGGRDPGEQAPRVAEAIPEARLVGVAGRDASPFVGDEVPLEIERFLDAPHAEPDLDRVLATILFTDIVGSTERAVELGDRAWRALLSSHRAQVRRELAQFRGVELDTAGDGVFASFDGPARAIRCARAIVTSAAEQGIQVRAGLHTGECEREGRKLAGIAVHTGARIAALAEPGEVLVSRTVKDLVAGSDLDFNDRGEQQLKGTPGSWQLYAVAS